MDLGFTPDFESVKFISNKRKVIGQPSIRLHYFFATRGPGSDDQVKGGTNQFQISFNTHFCDEIIPDFDLTKLFIAVSDQHKDKIHFYFNPPKNVDQIKCMAVKPQGDKATSIVINSVQYVTEICKHLEINLSDYTTATVFFNYKKVYDDKGIVVVEVDKKSEDYMTHKQYITRKKQYGRIL